MDLPRVMDILARRFATPLRVRIGGFRPEQAVPFTSRGQHLAERTFSVQGEAFVLVGWPADSLCGAGMPVDELRRAMNAAGVLHRYHTGPADVDNDLHLVVGHHAALRPARSPGPPPPSGTSWPPTRRTWPSACPTSRSSRPTRTRWRRRSTSAAFRLPRTRCWRLYRDRPSGPLWPGSSGAFGQAGRTRRRAAGSQRQAAAAVRCVPPSQRSRPSSATRSSRRSRTRSPAHRRLAAAAGQVRRAAGAVVQRLARAADDPRKLVAHPPQPGDAGVDLVDLRRGPGPQRRRGRPAPGDAQVLLDLGQGEADRLRLLYGAEEAHRVLVVVPVPARRAGPARAAGRGARSSAGSRR